MGRDIFLGFFREKGNKQDFFSYTHPRIRPSVYRPTKGLISLRMQPDSLFSALPQTIHRPTFQNVAITACPAAAYDCCRPCSIMDECRQQNCLATHFLRSLSLCLSPNSNRFAKIVNCQIQLVDIKIQIREFHIISI